MSSIYSQSGVNTPVERKIYQLSNVNSTETISTVSIRPCLNPAVPRMRILLAPYMSPYVVPVHKVKTWERLRATINALFGEQVFDGKQLRVTDETGRIVFPSAWADFIAPNVTIVVDTCSHLPKSSPVIFDTPSYAPATESYGMGLLRRLSESCRSRRSMGYENIESVTAMVLAERESEDHTYEPVRMKSPLEYIDEQTHLTQMDTLRPPPEPPMWQENAYEKRQTCISMFIPARGARPRARRNSISKKPIPPVRRSLDRRSSRELKRSATEVYRSVQEKQALPRPVAPPEKKPLKRNVSKWFKVSRVVLYACSRPQRESTQHLPLPTISEKQEYHRNPAFVPPDLHRKPSTQQKPVQKMKVEPVPLDTGRPMFDRTAYPQRSKSLGAMQRFNAALQSDPKTKTTKLVRSSSQQQKSSAQSRNWRISPPVPHPPAGKLGLNPQFAMQTTVSVDRIRELTNPRKAQDNTSQHSAATTSRIPETKNRNEKPLPRLPAYGGYSLFPAIPASPGLPDADRRPPTAAPLILRQPGAATAVRSRLGTPDGQV